MLLPEIKKIIDIVNERNPNEPEFVQAVTEVVESIYKTENLAPVYKSHSLLSRIIEPERTIIFRVPWVDDAGEVRINRGYRVQFSSAIGPYKGGLRFHPTVNLSILKFLGFEQVFKNSLTALPLGGGKGGSDFDPKGKSDKEVERFCQSFMSELFRHIGPDTDVPAGDIGVGGREIGYLYGQYKRLTNTFNGTLTGKGWGWGGSLLRPEATGFGAVYFAEEMLKRKGISVRGKKVVISGAGNVAQGVAEKMIELGATVITMSDSDGYILDRNGINSERLEFLKELKNSRRGRIKEYADKFKVSYVSSAKPWAVPADMYFPCATQNELDLDGAEKIIDNNALLVVEGANMPTTIEATNALHASGILFAPGKASNAGGVATSGLEMSQNSQRIYWTKGEVDERLRAIMKNIHDTCVQYGSSERGNVNYVNGANIGGYIRVADAMIAQGIV